MLMTSFSNTVVYAHTHTHLLERTKEQMPPCVRQQMTKRRKRRRNKSFASEKLLTDLFSCRWTFERNCCSTFCLLHQPNRSLLQRKQQTHNDRTFYNTFYTHTDTHIHTERTCSVNISYKHVHNSSVDWQVCVCACVSHILKHCSEQPKQTFYTQTNKSETNLCVCVCV